MSPYRFIAIEGNIGAGKTTLCEKLSAQMNCRLILEQFSDNPFLPLFYSDPERYAFSVELFFMTERHHQMQTMFNEGGDRVSIADYFFIKTLIFAQNNLKETEYHLFKRLFKVMNVTFPKPELLVYLHRPVEDLLVNIRKRGRIYESTFNPNYLWEIQQAYFNYFKTENNIPILILDVGNLNFVTNEPIFEQMKAFIFKPYAPGIHQIKLWK